MDARKTGSFIAELRKQKGYTQKELAEKLTVTDKAVSRWETGKGLPDTSLLKALSDLLGVSVGELLSGDLIEEEHIKEKTDQVILDSLKYSKRMLINMINIVLIAAGVILVLTPLFIAGRRGYSVLGITLVSIALLRVCINKRGVNMKISNKVIYSIALLCQTAALILEMLPYGVVLIFASGPSERITETFSYFSLTPFGYANFFPLPTGILTIAVIIMCTISLIKKLKVSKYQNAAFMSSIIAAVLSVMPLLLFGKEYMSTISYTISALILISVILQALANRQSGSTAK